MLTAKLFVNGSSQAVRLPKEYRFAGTEVYAQKIGDTVMLVPKEKAWETFLEGINDFTDDYIQIMESRSDDVPDEREML
ncbi:MAG: type II toxin-antitoxin system VapB family antitoxin [Ruminococcus sp.]|nr:type II toxin-antitoxin system VapB family antitoxin [Ruminococcus sp.]MDE5582565.1 type II toxin-antitoxin system VapB family antitoxin [Ruminococcus sp.]